MLFQCFLIFLQVVSSLSITRIIDTEEVQSDRKMQDLDQYFLEFWTIFAQLDEVNLDDMLCKHYQWVERCHHKINVRAI